ncbi:MAG: FAD-binding oxidoreductase [Armatimonadota bacterium]|nr:MAG: FAD-binding oxidoreductase [Armatimonadota bacterium]
MSVLSSALRSLEQIVGEEHLVSATEAVSAYGLEGQRPVAVAMPESREQVAELLRLASEQRLSVLLRGSGTHLYLGQAPGPIGLVLSLGRLNRIVEYDADDLTVTAEAGVTLGELQRVVGDQGQMLPLDPPGPDSATLGGIAATNLAGPMRMRHGTPRDVVLGLRVALTDGTIVKTGGKTVKNVAGYELNKLFVGSLGTLGAICQLTVRLTPVPEAKAIMVSSLPPSEAGALAAKLAASQLELATLEVANHAACGKMRALLPVTVESGRHVVFAGLMADREAVARQEREVRALAGDGCGRVDEEVAGEVWGTLRSAAYTSEPGAVVARASVPMSGAAAIMEMVSSWEGWSAIARAGSGLIYARLERTDDLPEISQKLVTLRRHSQDMGGFTVLEAGPVGLKRAFPVWGEEMGNLDLMRGLKQSLDPAGILGCGRLLSGQ